MSDVTQILGQIEAGDQQAASQLLPLIYDELRKLAAQKMASERKDHTLQATALVHEAYLRLVGANNAAGWSNRGHFFAAAAEAMRRILVDKARHKGSLRAGGEAERVNLDDIEATIVPSSTDILDLNEALEELEQQAPRTAELVKLRYFAGLSVRDAATVLEIAPSTAISDWAYAKGWLRLKMAENEHS